MTSPHPVDTRRPTAAASRALHGAPPPRPPPPSQTAALNRAVAPDAVVNHDGGGAEAVSAGGPVLEDETISASHPSIINAISQKILPLQHYLYNSQTDVCLIQEIWLKASVPQRFTTFPGYNVVRVDRSGRTGGGVAILVRDSFTLSRLPRPGVVNTASKLESVWVRVSVARHKAILFASLYRPPSAPGTQLTADLEQLESELELMLSRHRGLVVICADANCDMRYVTGNTTGAHLSSLLQTYNLSQIID